MGPINAKSLAAGLASGAEIVTSQLPVEPAAPCHWPLRKRAAVTRPKFREETPKEGVLNKYKKIVPKKHDAPIELCS